MSSALKDKVKGTLREAKGKVKEVAGKITDNPKLQGKGLIEKIAGKAGRSVAKYQRVMREYPFQIHDILEELRDGQMEIGINPIGLDEFSHKLDILTNRIVVAVVATALLLSSALLAAFISVGPRFFGVSLWGAPGFLIATSFGLWLLWAILAA